MWNKNRLTQMLSIEYPIIQAGMAGSTTPKLVASVSNSGGLGTIAPAQVTLIRSNWKMNRLCTPINVKFFWRKCLCTKSTIIYQ